MKTRYLDVAAMTLACLSASSAVLADPATHSATTESPQATSIITGIKAIGIHAQQIDKTLKFYVDGLGFSKVGEIAHSDSREVFLALSNAGSTPVLIVENAADPAAPQTSKGPASLVLTTGDIDKAIDRLKQQGYDVGAVNASPGRKLAVVHDPEGTSIELYQATRP